MGKDNKAKVLKRVVDDTGGILTLIEAQGNRDEISRQIDEIEDDFDGETIVIESMTELMNSPQIPEHVRQKILSVLEEQGVGVHNVSGEKDEAGADSCCIQKIREVVDGLLISVSNHCHEEHGFSEKDANMYAANQGSITIVHAAVFAAFLYMRDNVGVAQDQTPEEIRDCHVKKQEMIDALRETYHKSIDQCFRMAFGPGKDEKPN